MINVFVYGTLRLGHGNNFFMYGQEYLGTYKTKSDEYLLCIQGLPYVVPLTDRVRSMRLDADEYKTQITGDLYRVSRRTLDDLDMLEGHPHFYTRRSIHLEKKRGETPLVAWMYVHKGLPSLHNTLHIERSGDYNAMRSREWHIHRKNILKKMGYLNQLKEENNE